MIFSNMKNMPILIFLLMAALYGQWALWSNPSLPVGESDKGFGAEKGLFYYGVQSNFTFLDWWHDPLEEEPFKHSGSLNTFLLRPNIIYGISNKFNLMISSIISFKNSSE